MTDKAKPSAKPVAAAKAAVIPAAKSTKKPVAKKPVAAKPAKAVPAKTAPVKARQHKPIKTAKAVKSPKQDQPRKIKTVSDSFSMPAHEYAQLADFKKKCLKAGVQVKKSELLRAGLLSLAKLSDAELVNAMTQLKMEKPAKT